MTQLSDLIEGATWPHLAVENKAYDLLENSRPTDLICIDSEGETPLHYAAYNNDVMICKILLEKAPKLFNMKCYGGFTAFSSVQKEKDERGTHKEVYNYLLGFTLK